MEINNFRPLRSESRPKIGVVIMREIGKAAKIMPSHNPLAPRLSAYSGKSGTTIPEPNMQEKMDMAKIGKTLFIMGLKVL